MFILRSTDLNKSAALPFVIPSEAEGSVFILRSTGLNKSATLHFVIPTEAYPDFLPRLTGQVRVCAFL